MGLRDVLERRGREPLTPYDGKAWEEHLSSLGLLERYPRLVSGLAEGFDLGIPPIRCTYAPPNHPVTDGQLDAYYTVMTTVVSSN